MVIKKIEGTFSLRFSFGCYRGPHSSCQTRSTASGRLFSTVLARASNSRFTSSSLTSSFFPNPQCARAAKKTSHSLTPGPLAGSQPGQSIFFKSSIFCLARQALAGRASRRKSILAVDQRFRQPQNHCALTSSATSCPFAAMLGRVALFRFHVLADLRAHRVQAVELSQLFGEFVVELGKRLFCLIHSLTVYTNVCPQPPCRQCLRDELTSKVRSSPAEAPTRFCVNSATVFLPGPSR